MPLSRPPRLDRAVAASEIGGPPPRDRPSVMRLAGAFANRGRRVSVAEMDPAGREEAPDPEET